VILAAESICILSGMLPLVAGYLQFDLPPVAIFCLVIGLLWLASQWRRMAWIASLGILAFISMAGVGVWIGLSPFLMACSVLGSLLAWDLADFSRRLQRAASEDDLRQLEKVHLLRSGLLGGTGLILILATLFIHLRISFGWMFLLALVAVLGLVQLVKRLRGSG
jgi:hypothetical protein